MRAHIESEDMQDDEETLRELVALKRSSLQPKNLIYYEDELQECLRNVMLRMPMGKQVPWIEKMDISTPQPTFTLVPNVHDDKQRELVFYEEALKAAAEGAKRFAELEIPFERPADYFAEMFKSDQHMKKIKGRLLFQTKTIERAEEAQKIREHKRFGKQVQVQKQKEAQQKKRDQLDMIKKWKKGRQLGVENRSIDQLLEENEKNPAKGKDKFGLKKPSMKRQRKNEKYGGGKKDNRKSSNDPKEAERDWKNRKVNKKGSKKRPGKDKRKSH